MTQYSVTLTGPDEDDLLRLYKKYGYPKPGAFLRRTLQAFVANEGKPTPSQTYWLDHLTSPPVQTISSVQTPTIEEPPPAQPKTSLENLDDFLKEHLSTPSPMARKERVAVTFDNKRLIYKLYVVGNYYRERGSQNDQNPAFVWMDILTDGRTPSNKGIEIINRDFDKKVLRSKDKERYFVQNPDMPDADQYLTDYYIKWD